MKKFLIKLLCFIIIFIYINSQLTIYSYADTQETWPEYPEIFAQTGVVIDATTGVVLYNKNMNDKMYPASITKILTALVALENSSLDEQVTFSHDAVYSLEYADANIGMKEGEILSMNDALHGLLLASANETANAIAEHVGGSIDKFADMMNERAKEAGAVNSHFANPSGLFDENHYTTPYDMAMITKDAIKNQKFLDIEKDTTYTIGATNLTPDSRYLTNRHKMLLKNNPVYYEGVLGGKTGYLDEAGNTLVTFAKRDNMTLISVIMKSDTSHVYEDTTKLLDYGFNNFKLENIAENEKAFSFDDAANSSFDSVFNDNMMDIFIDKSAFAVVPKTLQFSDLTSKINFTKNSDDNTIATIKYSYAGVVVGTADVKLNNLYSENLIYSPLLENSDSDDEHHWSLNINYWLLIAIIIVIAIIVILFRSYRSALLARKRRRMRVKRRRK